MQPMSKILLPFRAIGLLLTLTVAAPVAAGATFVPDLTQLPGAPQVEVPMHAVQKALLAIDQGKGAPLQFAVRIPMALSLADGIWDLPETDLARWRLKLHSPGAHSLHVHFSELRLPPDAELWFYDAAGTRVRGPWTQAHDTVAGPAATAVVLGETAVLELRAPASQRDAAAIGISDVFHGYTDLRTAGGPSAKAGACQRDVACSEGSTWSDQIRSVVLLQIGNFACSGQLLNNVRSDNTPFLLTARHCGITSANASSVVAYFNFQRPSCGGGSGDLADFVSGASFRRSSASADSTLTILASAPPAEFNAYLSGWDASGSAVSSGAGIHHPNADEKSISLFNTALRKQDNVCAAQTGGGGCELVVDAWEVDWSSGATEPGSSGSGLWDAGKRLVGVLSGGASECSGAVGNGEVDYYGRFEVAWNSGNFRLDLDPDNTGAVVLNGKNASGGSTTGSTTGGTTGSTTGSTAGGTTGNTTGGLLGGSGGDGDSGGGGGGAIAALWILAALWAVLGRDRRDHRVRPDSPNE
jgi:lysyl endopeptidase